MASGFITLPDGNDWSSRWTRYDYVLETIMQKLNSNDEEGNLKKWLEFILPNEVNGDIESGYCFYKKTKMDKEKSVSILRIIDTRLMKEKYRKIFWNAVENLSAELETENTDIAFLINQLWNCYKASLLNSKVEPNLQEIEENLKLDSIFKIGGFDIG